MSGSVPLDDRGLLLGDGLFETVLVKAGQPVLWDAHVQRLARGCAALDLPTPDPSALALAASQAVTTAAVGQGRAALRLTWTAPRLLATVADAPRVQGPATLALVEIRRNPSSPTARHKTLAYLDNVMARRQARASGADEAVLLNPQGEIAGCAAANLFWIAQDRLHTPALDCGALEGIMRAQVIAAARAMGLAVVEAHATLTALEGAAAAFLTNSLIGVRPVSRIDGVRFGENAQIEALAKAVAEFAD